MTREEQRRQLNELYTQKNDLLVCLASKDYIGVKIAMGVATKEEYESEISQTQVWRSLLNKALDQIAVLEAITEFEDEQERPME